MMRSAPATATFRWRARSRRAFHGAAGVRARLLLLVPLLAHCETFRGTLAIVPSVALLLPDIQLSAEVDTDSYEDSDPTALADFHTALDPNGTWVDDKTYGTVWVPAATVVGADFTPYATAGHWVHDDDWVWASDYDWGWAPFHYGRWVMTDAGTWAWIPGRDYSGAWVSWGVDDDFAYVGWAPASPEFIWRGGASVAYSARIEPRFVYSSREEIFSAKVGEHVLAGPSAASVSGRVHAYAPAGDAHRAGPPPEKFGYTGAQVPHAEGTSAAGLARAKQFSRPSTAVKAGGHAATAGYKPPAGVRSTRTARRDGQNGGAPAAAGQKRAAPAAAAKSGGGGKKK